MTAHTPGEAARPVRPGGRGRGRARAFPKGRQVDETALAEVRKVLAKAPRRRDLLIEFLHLVQDRYGHLSAAHLAALAAALGLAQAEVFEVATFYHHFDVVKEGETAPPAVTIRVCDSLSCAMAGADRILNRLADKAPKTVRVVHAPCMGLCDQAPAAAVGHNYMGNVTVSSLLKAGRAGETRPVMPRYQSFKAYRKEGGYAALEALRRKAGKTPEEVIAILLDAGLKGLGGAGFPAGQKWRFVRAAPGPRYLCINGDEGEPGTFKDRYFLHTRPHQFLEGLLIAAWGVEAQKAYIYLRDEYPAARRLLAKEIALLEREGIAAPGFIEVRRGAGAYICGEESAMIESIEGKRGLPRQRPPYVATVGVFGAPTLVHNIETVYWMAPILAWGADWFAAQGKDGHKGPRSYSVSGRVKNPGVIMAPAGTTATELIALCGGMARGHKFKGYLPGGASGGVLPARLANIPLDFGGKLADLGCFVGSHAVVILSDQDDMREVAVNLLEFFEDESCGQCTPCRVGCEKAVKLMRKKKWDKRLLEDLSAAMADASICGLGQAAPNPIRTVMTHFKGEIS